MILILISTIVKLQLGLATMNGDTTSTNISRKSRIGSFINPVNNTEENTSRKSSIGIFSLVSMANNTEENTCRKPSVGSFSHVSLANGTEEEILQGTIMHGLLNRWTVH